MKNIARWILTRWLLPLNPFGRRFDLDAEIARTETLLATMYARQPFDMAAGIIDYSRSQAIIRKAERLLATLYYMRDEREKKAHEAVRP